MKKHRALISLVIILALLFPCMPVVSAKDEAGHIADLEKVLFNQEDYSSSKTGDTRQARQAIELLEKSVTIAIDQFGKRGKEDLQKLNDGKVPGIPDSLEDINPTPPKTQLSARNHRTYTHQGWNFDYEKKAPNGDLAQFQVRKNIMLATANSVFSFSTFSGSFLFFDFGYTDQCDAFCALLYYVHLIGDYIADCDPLEGSIDKYNGISNGKTIAFASYGKTDIYSELVYYIPKIFPNQNCQPLLSEIQTYAELARRDADTADGIISEESYPKMQKHVQQLMDLLTGENGNFNYIHDYLKNEPFFKNVFK